MVQWLRLHAPKAGNMGSISGLGTKMLHSMQHSWKKKENAGSLWKFWEMLKPVS